MQQTYQVHLGGGLVSSNRDDPGLGRTVWTQGHLDDLTDYVERLTRRFRSSGRRRGLSAHGHTEEDSLR